MQLKKNEQKYTNDVDDSINPQFEAREENEDPECLEEAINIDNLSQNIKSNMTMVDGVTGVESERKSQESGVKFETQSSLPEVVILDKQMYFTAFFSPVINFD